MRRLFIFISLTVLFGLLGCACKKAKELSKVSYDGEMIELYTPAPYDTFSWALVTGRASMREGFFNILLQSEMAEELQNRGVNLAAKAPDAVEFETSLFVTKEMAPGPGRIRAYSPIAEKKGSTEAAIIPVFLRPGSGDVHGVILRFYKALDTNNLAAAYELLVPQGQGYPRLYGGEAVFAPRPKKAIELKQWKREGERLRVLTLQPETMYDLPQENLFCYRAKIEHRIGDEKTIENTYVFLKRQPDGSFLLYRPRKDPHRAD